MMRELKISFMGATRLKLAEFVLEDCGPLQRGNWINSILWIE